VLIPTSAADPNMSAICFMFLSLINRICRNLFQKVFPILIKNRIEFPHKSTNRIPAVDASTTDLTEKASIFLTRQVIMPNPEYSQSEPSHHLEDYV
jgi:hypothetical protein